MPSTQLYLPNQIEVDIKVVGVKALDIEVPEMKEDGQSGDIVTSGD